MSSYTLGKKKDIQSVYGLPLLYQLIIENVEKMGVVPFIDDMPTGAIIGLVDIVGCSINDVERSDWAGFSDDPEHPVYNLHLAKARLFKDPITDVKGKQGIFEYDALNEDNLPEYVDIPAIRRDGDELFIPLGSEELEDYSDMIGEELSFDYNLLNSNLNLFIQFVDDELQPLSTEQITFYNGEKSLKFEVVNSELAFISDENGEDIEYSNPAGDILSLVKIFYTVKPMSYQ